MKFRLALIACAFITGCSANTRPSDDQLRSAVVAKLESNLTSPDVIARVRNADVDKVSCSGTEPLTCNFQVGGMAHVGLFTKAGDGVWSATSVD